MSEILCFTTDESPVTLDKKVKGAIVNFTSGAGLRGQENQVTYAAAKEAIPAMTRAAADE